MSHPTEPQVRAPLQERSRRTLARVLAAGWSLLESEGPDGLTVAAITSRARTSVGSFYARFRGKEDLLRYMAEQALEEAVAVWEGLRAELPAPGPDGPRPGAAPSSTELRAALDRAVSGLAGLYLDGAAGRVVQLDGVEDPSPSRRRRLEDRLAGDLAVHLGEGARGELAVRILAGTLHDAASRAGEGSPYPPGDVLVTELVELLNGYLGGEVPPPRAPEEPRAWFASAEAREEQLVAPALVAVEATRPAEPSGVDPAVEVEAESGAEPGTEPTPDQDMSADRGMAGDTDEETFTDAEADRDATPEPDHTPGPDHTPEPEETLDPFDVWG